MPLRTGPLSPIPLRQRIQAAAEAGYTGIGFGIEDVVSARDEHGYRQIEAMLLDHGLNHLELEYLDSWWTDTPEATATRTALLEASSALGAHHIKVGAGLLGQIVDKGSLQERLHALAEQAARAGVKIALEAAAFSMLPNIQRAAELVRAVDHPNAGLLLDIWHIYRGGTPYGALGDIVSPGSIFAVELDDGLALPSENLYEDTFDHRKLCGHGDFDVVAFIKTVRALGYTGPWGVEMMSIDHRRLEPEKAARLALGAAADCFTAAIPTSIERISS